ncbi:hypothetical protein PMAYCL1PPCAC_05337, partial [Pristionchus mayeri]
QVFTRNLTLLMIPLILIVSLIPSFVTISAPGHFLDITEANDTVKIYMLHAVSEIAFPSIDRSALCSIFSFVCNGLCFAIYSWIAFLTFSSRVNCL